MAVPSSCDIAGNCHVDGFCCMMLLAHGNLGAGSTAVEVLQGRSSVYIRVPLMYSFTDVNTSEGSMLHAQSNCSGNKVSDVYAGVPCSSVL